MSGAAATSQKGIGIGSVLLGAAVLGTLGGLVLAWKQRPPPSMHEQAEALAAQVIPAPPAQVAQARDVMEADPISVRGLPAYPGANPRRLIGPRPGGPQLFAVSWFETGDSVDKVLSFYEQAFSDANIWYTSHRFNQNRGYVSWLEHEVEQGKPAVPGAGVLHMVTASREVSRTVVLLSATEPKKILENLEPLPAGVKLPPNGQPQVINTSEFGQQRATIYATYALSVDQLLAQLQATLEETGWKVVESQRPAENAASLSAADPRRQLNAYLKAEGEGAQLVVMVEEISEGSSP